MKTILVADDNEANRELVTIILEREGYRVIGAANGREALDLFQQQKPDLVLLDIHMPEMNGYDAVRAMRAQSPVRVLPMVALTASAMPGDSDEAMSHGFDAYLAKPYEISTVIALVKQMLNDPSEY
ncbi:MAG: response regulator [Acidobacteria bacterium]|nr:response regulator [Acidobacteriota bacterium]